MWKDTYKNYKAQIFDHSPILIKVHNSVANVNRPSKYFHMWSKAADFDTRVRTAWNTQIHGCVMFKVVRKLKLVKQSLNKLNKEGFNQIQVNEAKALQTLKGIHLEL